MSSSKKRLSFLKPILLIVLLFFISIIIIAFSLLKPINSADKTTITFVIPKGQSTRQIAQRLRQAGLLRSGLAFRIVAYQGGLQNKIQAGSFKLSPSLSTWELAQALTKGTDDLWLTIPEGWRREEIAASLSKQDLNAFNEQDFLDLSSNLEGQLFPDTYLVSKSVNAQTLVNLLHSTFESKVLLALDDELSENELSLNQILTFASLVQRESANEAEMPLVAGILFNRLNTGMPLQVDATLQYIKAYSAAEQNWWSTPTAMDKGLNSPFNTYQNLGLPPSPICNPGLAAIEAVLKPQSTNAFYYIHDLSGRIHTAETLEGHNANVNQYLR